LRSFAACAAGDKRDSAGVQRGMRQRVSILLARPDRPLELASVSIEVAPTDIYNCIQRLASEGPWR